MKARLAVVVPCYNYGAFLDEAVASVLAAQRTDIELVIIDDGSTDPFTLAELDRLAATGLRVLRQKNQGLAATRDAGIRATSADYILPLDADNKIRPIFIATALEILDRSPDVGVVYGDAEYFGARTGRWTTGPFQEDRLMRWNYIDACAALRRSVWEQNGGYDRTMPLQGLEDWDMWLGASSRGWKFSYVPQIFFDYRVKQQSMITDSYARSEETAAFMARKHAVRYRTAWMQLDAERRSFKTSVRRSCQLGLSRIIEFCLGRNRE